MISDILGFWTPGLFVLAVPVVLIILVVIYVARGSKGRQKLHQKMPEHTDELNQTQEQLKE